MVFKQVFRIAFIALIWKQYKAWIVSTVLLFTSLYLIGQVHADFLQHWKIQDDNSHTGQSFIIKWLAYIVTISLYCLFHFFRPKKSSASDKKKDKAQQKKLKTELENLPSDADPFSSIRKRKKLRSRSDFILERSQKDKE